MVKREYQTYLKTRKSYYKEEQRWTENSFWKRRFGDISLNANINLIINKNSSSLSRSRYLITNQEEELIKEICMQPAPLPTILQAFSHPPHDYKSEENILLMVQHLIKKGKLKIEN